MLTINFPRHDPSSRTLDAFPARDLTHSAPAQPGNGEPGVACSASDFPHTGALGYASIWRRPSLLLGKRSRSLGRIGLVGPVGPK
jgi:hypothetical protein